MHDTKSIIRNTPAILLLADGTHYIGKAVGKIGIATGELCFNTGMTGYQEVFTDPSYYGQLLVTTVAHIGNYGAKATDVESGGVKIAGLICKNFNDGFSRPMADAALQEWAQAEGLVGITDIDTRALVRHIRSKGAMNGIISSETLDLDALHELLAAVPSMEGLELASHVSTSEAYTYGNETATYRVAVMDYGVKRNILENLAERGCFLKVFPAKSSIEEVNAFLPDGYFISNGPGDPAAMPYAVETTREMMRSQKPIFGICLGQQILAEAVGISTLKMHHGHRGINHPVKNLLTGRSEITSQNHGFSIDPASLAEHLDRVEVTHINLNDDTIEGIRLRNYPAFAVQYHPEAGPGPHDARYLFDDFLAMMAK